MPIAFVFDYNPEAADTRAETVSKALHAAGAEDWTVQATVSRNALLAKLAARAPGLRRDLALIDLYDGEGDRGEQTGHRMVATIAGNPSLRLLCAACACTIYTHPDLVELMASWGATALIDATAARQAEPRALGDFLLALGSQPLGKPSLIEWPGRQTTIPARDDELAVLRYVLSAPDAPAWQPAAVAMMAGGLENAQIARHLLATGELDVSPATAQNKLSELRKLIMQAAPNESDTRAANTVYSRIAAQAPLPNDTRKLPALSVLRTLATDRLIHDAACLTDAQHRLLQAINSKLASRPSSAGRGQDAAAEAWLGEAVLALAPRFNLSTRVVWRITKFGMFCVADAIADYVKHPQVELAHRLLALERDQGFTNWLRDHRGRPLMLFGEPEIAITAQGRFTVGGITGEQWELMREPPPPRSVELVAGLEGNIARFLRARFLEH